PDFNAVDVTPTYVGQTPYSFSVSGSLPAGVDFDSETGALPGVATETFDAELTFTAHVGEETATRDVRLVVTPGIGNLRYVSTNTADRDTLFMNIGVAVNLVPEYDGGPADSTKVTRSSPSRAAGVTRNKAAGASAGTPAAGCTGRRAVTAYSGNVATPRNVRFGVTLGRTSALAYNDNSSDVDAGESI